MLQVKKMNVLQVNRERSVEVVSVVDSLLGNSF